MPTVIAVRMKKSADGKHEHIAKVKTRSGRIRKRQRVFDSIESGEKTWWSSGGDTKARIEATRQCTRCSEKKKFIRTAPDHSKEDNLENLPQF